MKIVYLAFVELDIPNACRTHVVEVVQNLAELGHQIIAVLPQPLAPVQFPDGVRVSYVYPWSFSWPGRILFCLFAAVKLCYFFIVHRPDVVYEREMGHNPFPVLLCRLFKVPFVVEVNGFRLDDLTASGVGKFPLAIERCLQYWELQASAGVVIPSDHLYARFLQEYSLSPDDCAFIFNGFNPQVFSPGNRRESRARMGLPSDSLALVFVGCLSPYYDLFIYLRIVKRLQKEYPALVLWIIGDGPNREKWEAGAKALGIEKRVLFAGYQPESAAVDWIRASNLCLVPHTASGLIGHGALSTKIWAYAACARAMLLHFDPQQRFPDELLPLFRRVSPEDEVLIELAVRKAIENPDALDREGAANSVWVHTNATWSHTAKRTVAFIEKRIGKCVA